MDAPNRNTRRQANRDLRAMTWELERESWTAYLQAGAPFGFAREALSVWMEHGGVTTAN